MRNKILIIIMLLAIGAASSSIFVFAQDIVQANEIAVSEETFAKKTYNWSDEGGGYELILVSATQYNLVATNGPEIVSCSGNYSISGPELTLYFDGKVFKQLIIDGTVITEKNNDAIPSFSARVSEWLTNNLPEFLSAISVALSGIFVSVILPFIKKKMTSVNTTVLTNLSSQEAVVGVVNQLIEKYNEVEAKLGEIDNKEVSRDALQSQFAICQKAILEILTTVYNNSKNIPQATKDLVNLQYVKFLKSENDTAEVLKENGGE